MLMDWANITEKFSSKGLKKIRHNAGRLAEETRLYN